MYSPEEILDIVQSKAELLKDQNKVPDFGPVYATALKYKLKLMPHYDPEFFPSRLFVNRSPNQSQVEYSYAKDNYKAITYVVWDRFKTVLRRIWNDANWSISDWGNVDSKYKAHQPQAYFEENYPIFMSLENYYKGVVTDTKEKDPNAVIVHKPKSIPVKQNGSGEFVIDDQIIIEPIAFIFPCEQVIAFDEDMYFLGLSDDKSIVLVNDKEERTGLVFEFYDKNNIWRVKQVGQKKDMKLEVMLYWNHELGYLPCKILKAEPAVIAGNIVYKSHFMPAVEPLDIALLDNSNLLIAKNRSTFPKFWEYQADCDFSHAEYGACTDGYIYVEGKQSKCPSCKGSGQKSMGPMETYVLPMPTRLNPELANISPPPAGYIQPEIDTPKFLDEQVDKNINRGLSILNLNVSTTDVKGGNTALARQIDREEQFSFLVQISSQIFHLFEFSLITIQKMRYGNNAESPKVNYPKNFSIRNEYDLTEEISNAKDSGMPDIGIRQLIVEYFNTRFNNNELAAKVIDLVFYSDRLVTLSSQEIAQKLNTGVVAKWEDILHTSINQFIEESIQLNDKFLSAPITEQKAMLIELAKAKEVDITPKRVDPNSIIANANTVDA